MMRALYSLAVWLAQPLVRRKLRAGGVFHLATDWAEYAEWMLQLMSAVW